MSSDHRNFSDGTLNQAMHPWASIEKSEAMFVNIVHFAKIKKGKERTPNSGNGSRTPTGLTPIIPASSAGVFCGRETVGTTSPSWSTKDCMRTVVSLLRGPLRAKRRYYDGERH